MDFLEKQMGDIQVTTFAPIGKRKAEDEVEAPWKVKRKPIALTKKEEAPKKDSKAEMPPPPKNPLAALADLDSD